MCRRLFFEVVNGRGDPPVISLLILVLPLCADVVTDMCIDRCTGMCIGVFIDMCIRLGMGVCGDIAWACV